MNQIELARPLIFLTIVAILSIWQFLNPVFQNTSKKRIFTNIAILIVSTFTLKIIFPLGIATSSLWSQYHHYFLVALHKLPFMADLIITILLFDFLIYWQHRLMHLSPLLWRLHKVHHADFEMDFSSGVRFHPLEIIFSGFYKSFFLVIFTPRIEVFLIYEIILNSMAIFNHSNINVPFDKWIRLIIVTPQMHFPHHSQQNKFMNLNFGNFLSFWDRLFGTYTNDLVQDFGLKEIDNKSSMGLLDQLVLPFWNSKGKK